MDGENNGKPTILGNIQILEIVVWGDVVAEKP